MSKEDGIGLTDVLTELGNDNYKIQLLSNCMTGFKQNKHQTKIEFGTEVENTPRISGPNFAMDTPKIGVILWIDRDDYEKAYMAILERKKEGDSDAKVAE